MLLMLKDNIHLKGTKPIKIIKFKEECLVTKQISHKNAKNVYILIFSILEAVF